MSSHQYPKSIKKLVNELSKLPTIGEKTALRLAYHLVTGDQNESLLLAKKIKDSVENVQLCANCFFLSEESLCTICQDTSRERNIICVVERPADVLAIERTSRFNGLYHVLHGLWSPAQGVKAQTSKLGSLFDRVLSELNPDDISEVLVATGTTVEGDATALYIANTLNEAGIRVSRIAQGMPKGGELEFADEVTLTHAIQGRKQF